MRVEDAPSLMYNMLDCDALSSFFRPEFSEKGISVPIFGIGARSDFQKEMSLARAVTGRWRFALI